MMFPKQREEQKNILDFEAIRISIASPETILRWSYGEVTKPETINYRTQKPEKGGLFCERIFGPVKDYECNCGRYKGPKYKGVVCERCGVEVTLSRVRRERMGHIELAVPVAHIWFYKVVPSRIGLLLDLTKPQLQSILYYENYIVTDPGDTPLNRGQLLSPEDYEELVMKYHGAFTAKMGAEGIYDLLKEIDLEETSKYLKALIKKEKSLQRKKSYLKKLKVVEAFRNSGNKPEWMILKVLPVIPPDLRPLVPLEGGRYATSDVNDLYRRVITRNNRLKSLMEINAPEIILRNEKRMLQEAVDALLDNSRMSRPIKGRGNRPLKSLSDSLKGKSGRFRQNLLGKRVDYSGRSVITVDPKLKLHECGLPKVMALELFKPFVIRKLEEKKVANGIKNARQRVEDKDPVVWDILEMVVKDHPVLLNRAPTLHRLSIQAFLPKLVDGKAIRIHPLVCPPFNADFDGDQMAVHVPLSFHAQLESYLLMLSPFNILSPANGQAIAAPTQDMVAGIYFLTVDLPHDEDKPKRFYDTFEEVEMAVETGVIDIHTPIKFYYGGEWIDTTAGKVIFNEILPEGLRWINKTIGKGDLKNLVLNSYRMYGSRRTAQLLDALKEFGFEWASRSGLTIGIDDMIIPEERKKLIDDAMEEQGEINRAYKELRQITERERYNQIIQLWSETTHLVEKQLKESLRKDRDGLNPIFIMANSGARGNWDQVRQISGMRGLMAKPQKRLTAQAIIETPILHSLKEGLTVVEYFISSHGARKGLTDTALKTAEAGYLTRRLVDVAQDVVITEEDCGTVLGRDVQALMEGGKIIEPLSERIAGRFTADDVYHPITGEIILKAGEEITDELAKEIEAAGIESVKVRSVLTCEAKRGICQKCYGRNLATGRLVEIGEAVGIVAAQSIGEPGTQLTLRTFHVGGVAALISEQNEQRAPFDGEITLRNVIPVKTGKRNIVLSRNGLLFLTHKKGRIKYTVPYGAEIFVKDGQKIKEGDVLFRWDPYSNVIISEQPGTTKFVDIIPNITMKEVVDEEGRKQPMIIEEKTKTYHPAIEILNDKGESIGTYSIPTGAYLFVKDGQKVRVGDLLAKLPKDIAKTRDITAGLPRVAELFEAKSPSNKAVVSEIDGIVRFGEVKRGMRIITVEGENETREYQVPYRKYLTVHDGQKVKAGDKLCEGQVDPHDILKIKGVLAAQQYLLNEIQEVYRLQGVKIDDKHIGIIVRQMFRKVRIKDPGDTKFIEGEIVNKDVVQNENMKVIEEGGKPATVESVLLGITRASLSTESFISAASFQETTRVLTDAAIQGKVDYLLGLKENVIIGNRIPAGTGMKEYRNLQLLGEEEKVEKGEIA